MIQPEPGHVTVRMYNVGFGDAFLLAIPANDRPRFVLIDVGTHSSGQGPRPVSAVVDDIIADVTGDDGNARIDVVVATHRHQDHVSGFQSRAWDNVEVGEVWMPWTEDPDDPDATSIRERQSRAALQLCLALERLGAAATPGASDIASNNLTNAKAMQTLHEGFANTPTRRFLGWGVRRRAIRTPELPGVRVHVLGPSKHPDVIRDMNPPAGESYLRLMGADAEGGNGRPPFAASWDVPAGDIDENPAYADLCLKPRDKGIIAEVAAENAMPLAVALEQAVNGTSLMLMFEIGDARLLFPGDAQWGTWRRVLDNDDARALVEAATFLKVGHHGSHNATPKDYVEALKKQRGAQPGLRAMVSTHPVRRWPSIPKAELLDAICEVTPWLARSDDPSHVPADGFVHADEAFVEARVPI